jgi:hypothetical protein
MNKSMNQFLLKIWIKEIRKLCYNLVVGTAIQLFFAVIDIYCLLFYN